MMLYLGQVEFSTRGLDYSKLLASIMPWQALDQVLLRGTTTFTRTPPPLAAPRLHAQQLLQGSSLGWPRVGEEEEGGEVEERGVKKKKRVSEGKWGKRNQVLGIKGKGWG